MFAAKAYDWFLWYGTGKSRRMSVRGYYSVRCKGLAAQKPGYTDAQIEAMLLKAEKMGYSLESGCELESWTLAEIDELVNGK